MSGLWEVYYVAGKKKLYWPLLVSHPGPLPCFLLVLRCFAGDALHLRQPSSEDGPWTSWLCLRFYTTTILPRFPPQPIANHWPVQCTKVQKRNNLGRAACTSELSMESGWDSALPDHTLTHLLSFPALPALSPIHVQTNLSQTWLLGNPT